MGERAVAARPDYPTALKMRANACVAVGDLRQAIRDCRRLAELYATPDQFSAEGKAAAEAHAKNCEAALREQIEAQVAALRLRDDAGSG